MRILVTGDRYWFSPPPAAAILGRLVKRYGPDIVIVHGGASGIDESFELTCRGMKIEAEEHPVTDEECERIGKRAGGMNRPFLRFLTARRFSARRFSAGAQDAVDFPKPVGHRPPGNCHKEAARRKV